MSHGGSCVAGSNHLGVGATNHALVASAPYIPFDGIWAPSCRAPAFSHPGSTHSGEDPELTSTPRRLPIIGADTSFQGRRPPQSSPATVRALGQNGPMMGVLPPTVVRRSTRRYLA